jgi:hypothetical protein
MPLYFISSVLISSILAAGGALARSILKKRSLFAFVPSISISTPLVVLRTKPFR